MAKCVDSIERKNFGGLKIIQSCKLYYIKLFDYLYIDFSISFFYSTIIVELSTYQRILADWFIIINYFVLYSHQNSSYFAVLLIKLMFSL